MEVDYIIVGCGIAGISFCEQLNKHNNTFIVFDDNSQQSSSVAGGLYNPVVLKRFTPVWKSKEQLEIALNLYHHLEAQFDVKLDYKLPVYRKFASLEEQNDWFTASDKPILSEYLSSKVIKNENPNIDARYGFGEVKETGRIDVKEMQRVYKEDLLKKGILLETPLDYTHLSIEENGIHYRNIKAKHLVFSDGSGIKQNPFFNYLPLVPAKGELLTIYAPDLNFPYVLKSAIFLIPLGNHLYIVGATYNWKDLTNAITDSAKNELVSKLKKLINCPFEIVNHVAGVRPTVKDRRPLVGQHPQHKNMFLLNGLGTRGIMIGPYVAEQLYNYIEHHQPLESEIDIKRFDEN